MFYRTLSVTISTNSHDNIEFLDKNNDHTHRYSSYVYCSSITSKFRYIIFMHEVSTNIAKLLQGLTTSLNLGSEDDFDEQSMFNKSGRHKKCDFVDMCSCIRL